MQSGHIQPRSKLAPELDRLDARINELKFLYEQHFMDPTKLAPGQKHDMLKKEMRRLMDVPLKNSTDRFRLKSLNQKYQSLNNYWARVLQEREKGTYKKDVFKAKLREKSEKNEKFSNTTTGQAETKIKDLFTIYRDTLMRTGQDTSNLEYQKFKNSLLKRSVQLKQEKSCKKLKYRVTVENGHVKVQATPLDEIA